MIITEKIKYYNNYLRLRRQSLAACEGYKAKLYHWFAVQSQDLWLPRFIENRKILKNKEIIALFTINGPRWLMKYIRADKKVFVARENLHRKNHESWRDLCLNEDSIDLVMGFDDIVHHKYIKFPFWLMWSVFDPCDTYEDIRVKVNWMNSQENHSFADRKFCAFLCSHDDIGRSTIYEAICDIDPVDCDGKLFHNNDDLNRVYNNDKLAYLRQYRFNLTPENSNTHGYVTEKLLEAIWSGCIPIYNGGNNVPEPSVFNNEAIVFFDWDHPDNPKMIEFIRRLNSSEKEYLEFSNQPRFVSGAEDVIWGYYERLEQRLREICANI